MPRKAKARQPDDQTSLFEDGVVGTALERGLPCNLNAERMVLGSIFLNARRYLPLVAGMLVPDDFSLEKHRKIYSAVLAVDANGQTPDRVTVANELMRLSQLETVDGLSYLVSLDEGMPELYNPEDYARIVKDKATLRGIIFAAQGVMEQCYIGESTPCEIVERLEARITNIYAAGEKPEPETLEEYLDSLGGVDKMFVRDFTGACVPPWKELSRMVPHILPGQLVIVAARPGMGKTVVMLQMAARMARDERVAFFSLEVDRQQLYDRMVSAYAAIDHAKIQLGAEALSRTDREAVMRALSVIRDLKLHILDSDSATVYSIRRYLSKMKALKKPVKAVFIDYLQLMSDSGFQKRYDAVSAISRGLKLLAKEFRIPIIVACQLNRQSEFRPGGIPELQDLRESGSIEQDADKVLMLHRPEKYSSKSEDAGVFHIYIRKNRQGKEGRADLIFEPEYQRVMSPKDAASTLPLDLSDGFAPVEPTQHRLLIGEEEIV